MISLREYLKILVLFGPLEMRRTLLFPVGTTEFNDLAQNYT